MSYFFQSFSNLENVGLTQTFRLSSNDQLVCLQILVISLEKAKYVKILQKYRKICSATRDPHGRYFSLLRGNKGSRNRYVRLAFQGYFAQYHTRTLLKGSAVVEEASGLLFLLLTRKVKEDVTKGPGVSDPGQRNDKNVQTAFGSKFNTQGIGSI